MNFREMIIARLKQPSTMIGVTTAAITLLTGGAAMAPQAITTLLAALGLIVVNA